MIVHGTNTHARLFEHFTTHGVFEAFTRLYESGQRGIKTVGPVAVAAEQASVLVLDQHDDGRIGAWKMLFTAAIAGAHAHVACV